MPEANRNRLEPMMPREIDPTDAHRLRPGFGPTDDPLAELARIVGETAPTQASVTSQRRQSTEPAAPREYPRRDTSWRDPQAQTTVRAGLKAQPMPGQLEDLEAELFSEIHSENLRNLPPAPDLAQLGLPDARMPQYAAKSRPITGNSPVAATQPLTGLETDDDVTLPMHAVLRGAPQPARATEDHRMQQPLRFTPAPVHDTAHDEHSQASDEAWYHEHADYDPAGALGDGYHDYDAAEDAYYADAAAMQSMHGGAVDGQSMHPPMPAYDASNAHYQTAPQYEEDDDTYAAYQAPRVDRRPPRRVNFVMLGALAVVGVVVVGIGGLFTYRAIAGNGATGAYAPLIRADTKPMKEQVAQAPLAASGPNLDSSKPDGQDKLVTQTEDPVDQIPGKPNVRVVGPGSANSQNPTLAPIQHVRSVIVRPDGSIVTPDDATSKSPGQTAALSTPAVSDAPAPVPAPPPTTAPTQAAPTQPALPPLGSVAHIDTVPVRPAPIVPTQPTTKAPVAQVTPPAPKPVSKPTPVHAATPDESNGPLSLDPSGPTRPAPTPPPVHVANAQPAASQPRPAPNEAGTGDYMVQISSQRSDAEARHALATAEQKYAALGAKGGDVQQADLPGRGTYYRARLSGGTRDQAAALCAQIKAQGGDCVVAKR